MRNLSDALLWRGTRRAADYEAAKLKAAARRQGYDIEVRPTRRRYGKYVYEEQPFGLFLVPHRS
jgi:hypothetical protein